MEVGPIQNDYAGGLTSGIIGLMNQGKPRKPDDWGALSAWSWGLSRAMDYFETDKSVDAHQMGVEGHSRYGKAALLAAALDPRWAIVFPSCSGEGGAKPSRRYFGETLDNVATSHWIAPELPKIRAATGTTCRLIRMNCSPWSPRARFSSMAAPRINGPIRTAPSSPPSPQARFIACSAKKI